MSKTEKFLTIMVVILGGTLFYGIMAFVAYTVFMGFMTWVLSDKGPEWMLCLDYLGDILPWVLLALGVCVIADHLTIALKD